jgi:hypothetical protein
MNRSLVLSLCLVGAVACSSSSNNSDAGPTTDAGTTTDAGNVPDAGNATDGGMAMNPAPPALKTMEVDRMGRAGVNTALTAPFAAAAAEDKAKNDYNAEADRSKWVASFQPEISGNLAILDGLDTVCGNQILAGPMPVMGRYGVLSGVLADDVLSVNTASGTCMQYLAVEANATGLAPNMDCGGRTPLYDTIDTTYSVLAVGKLSGVTDGVDKDADGTATTTTFPFLDVPNQ